MAGPELAMIVVIGALCIVVALLAFRLGSANRSIIGWANKCLEHSMAWHEDQRHFMRNRLEAEQAEVLLRERRNAAGIQMPAPRPIENDGSDIRVNTGIVAD